MTGQLKDVGSAASTAFVLGDIALTTLAVSVPTVLQAVLAELEPETCDRRLERWSAHLVARAGVEIQITGTEHVSGSRAFVVMSNHQSYFDIPVLYRSIPLPMRMVVKKELFRIPVWASAMRAAGFIEIDRQGGQDAHDKLHAAGQELLASGRSLWLAPEGTRSPSGELLPFKRGGFLLAIATGLPILPVTLKGTRDAHAKGSWTIHRGARAQVTIHAPIDPRSFAKGAGNATGEASVDLEALMNETRRVIAGPLST